MTPHLAAVRAAIIKAIPEILDLKFGCVIRHKSADRAFCNVYGQDKNGLIYYYHPTVEYPAALSVDECEILGRKITIADVLRAIRIGLDIAVDNEGFFYEYEDGYLKQIHVQWDLKRDDLNFASPELLAFLHGLLV